LLKKKSILCRKIFLNNSTLKKVDAILNFKSFKKLDEKAASLLEMIIALGIVAVLFTPIFATFFQITKQSSDSEIISLTEDRARTVRDIIAYDLRAAGAGMPLGQSNYTSSTTGVTSDAMPVLTGATKTNIQFRMSEKGEGILTTTDLTPSASSRVFTVHSSEASKFKVGDTVYLSNFTTGGSEGLKGTISAIAGGSITLDSVFSSSPSATFRAGTLVQKVKTITLTSGTITPTDGTGIMRNDGTGQGNVLLAPNSRFELYYLEADGTQMNTPLSLNNTNTKLVGIFIKVYLSSAKPLSTGQYYVAEGSQGVALKNKLLGSMAGSDMAAVPPGDGNDDFISDVSPTDDTPIDANDNDDIVTTTSTTTPATTTTTTSTNVSNVTTTLP
jgi:hypothetical protein